MAIELRCGERLLDLSETRVMGILNATPDSFSDGGQLLQQGRLNLAATLDRARAMVAAGASILDVGGESTRPGADPVSTDEELARVIPVIELIARQLDVVISVDTSSPQVMLAAAAAGAGMINDVRALRRSGALQAAAATGLAVCLMHMRGEPKSMQSEVDYPASVTNEVIAFLRERAEVARAAGIDQQRIVLDPGFGFSKNIEHNVELLQNLPQLVATGYPILTGMSRKSMIGTIAGREVGQRLAGSLACALLATQAGVKILRVHDVAETVDVLKVLSTCSVVR